MGQIKEIVKTLFSLLVMVGCLIFAINVFFFSEIEYGMGIFGTAGAIFSPLAEDDLLANEGINHMNGIVSEYIPVIRYNAYAKCVGDCVKFKDLLSVTLENGNSVSGSSENGFAIYLKDIRTKDGNSAVKIMSASEIAQTQIANYSLPFIYDKENDLLYIFKSGTYDVKVRIYADSGGQQTYEFQLPIEEN